ncbi:MAG: L-rhamnose isomerase [Clostridia bacterium]|nr:L-rhamnose isomerase [Clostridia bacterium]
MNTRYDYARADYASRGIDTEAALAALAAKSISMHCWQGDDLRGFDGDDEINGGGIQATGNYPGAARTPAELMADIDRALSLIPGKHRLNLHASYAIFADGETVDRDKIEPRHFAPWVEYARARGLGVDFNPTCFAHPKAAGMTLAHPDPAIRRFWIDHCIACIRISEYFARELGSPCLMNIWIPDGLKDTPADRYAPRARFAESLDEILACGYDKSLVHISLESKVFGIGLESYTVGSSEFCMAYAASRGIVPLMDNGHYHPTEVVSDKLPSMYLFYPTIALHVTRGVRWDSDHVVRLDDETTEIAREIVRCNALDRTLLGLDFFDASINRVAAWVIGMRNMQKALLIAMLTPHKELAALQESGDGTALLAAQEDLKSAPWGEVWAEFCRRSGVPADGEWMADVLAYEKEILAKRS